MLTLSRLGFGRRHRADYQRNVDSSWATGEEGASLQVSNRVERVYRKLIHNPVAEACM